MTMFVYMYTYVYVCIYVYIYVYSGYERFMLGTSDPEDFG
jgi:hypothetical protein